MGDQQQDTENKDVYSALTNRPVRKVVDDSDTTTYVAGVKITDTLTERKRKFNGWENDPDAQMVVRSLQIGEQAKFSGSDFSEVDFSGANLSGVNFSGADLKNANLAGVDLRNANLAGADLRGVNLEEADLTGADLTGAILDGAYLKNAIIAGAKLAKVALNELEKMQQLQQQAEDGLLDLRKVPLKYLDLRKLDLRGVDLTGVDLSGVSLVGVNLSGAKIDQQYIDGTYLFKEGANRKVEIKKGNVAGLDLTSANIVKSKMADVEILRKKRQAQVQADAEKMEQELKQSVTEQKSVEKILNPEEVVEAQRAAMMALNPNFGSEKEQTPVEKKNENVPVEISAENMLDQSLAILKARRQQQPSEEELKARIKDVVLENTSLKSGAKSLVTRRPRKKEELPASEFDFPILYPLEKEVEKKSVEKSLTQEVKNVVSNVFHKIIPVRSSKRVRVKQRQRQRT